MQRRWTLTENELKAVPDKDLVQKIIVSVLEFVGELSSEEDDYELARQTPKSAQFFWAMRLLESEVNNGGFEQYFWNSSCTLVGVTLEAYRAIGARTYVDFIQRALAIVGSDRWTTRRQRFNGDWRTYKRACPPALDALDNEFYAAGAGSPDSGGQDTDLQRRQVEYIRQNAKAVCGA
ncbi:MAG: DUF4375 domain-containing protein [Candidatus Sulfotelmatobacter sp.]